MHKSTVVLWLCGGFLLGVWVGSVYPDRSALVWAWFSLASLGFLCALVWSSKRWRYAALALGIVLCGSILGQARISHELGWANEYTAWYQTKQDFEAVVVSEADRRPDKQLVTVRPEGFQQSVLLTLSPAGTFLYGDRVWVRGKVGEPKSFDDFDYPGYLAKNNIYALMNYPKVIVLEHGAGNYLMEKLLAFKQLLLARVRLLYSEHEAGLLLGLLLGVKKALPDPVVNQFRVTGTSHIMAVSGFNISILLIAMAALSRFVGRRWGSVLGFFLVTIFVVLVGPSGSVIRAALMGYATLLTFHVGRVYLPAFVLLQVAALMCLHNPRILYWDVGFMLSFAATLGIVLVLPIFDEHLGKGWKKLLLAQALVTVAATAFTLPITLWQFGQWSQVGVLANLLIAPLIVPAMGLGALSLLPVVGPGFAMLNSLVLEILLGIVSFLSSFSFASREMQLSGGAALALFFALVLSAAWGYKKFGSSVGV